MTLKAEVGTHHHREDLQFQVEVQGNFQPEVRTASPLRNFGAGAEIIMRRHGVTANPSYAQSPERWIDNKTVV